MDRLLTVPPLLQNLFAAFGSWVIRRAMRTPYMHLRNRDGSPYMDRYWLLRIGTSERTSSGELVPWIGLRVHHIRSSDDGRDFHDHPWPFFSLILRGGYVEETPYDGNVPSVDLRHCPSGEVYTRREFAAGDLLFRRAEDWHRLRLPDYLAVVGTWTLVLTLPYKQGWGFRVDGQKVPWRTYFQARRFADAAARVMRSNMRGVRRLAGEVRQ